MALPIDIIVRIVKALPLKEQYDIAVQLFPCSKGNDYACEFAENYVYMSEMISHVYDDLPEHCVVKHNPMLILNSSWKIDINTEIWSLPSGLKTQIHKIPVWENLYRQGYVGKYALKVVNSIVSTMERFEVTTIITCDHPDKPFIVDVEVEGYDNNQELIMRGTRMNSFIPPTTIDACILPKGDITYSFCNYNYHIIMNIPKEDIIISSSCKKQACCPVEDYNVGLSKDQMYNILYR